MDSHAHMTRQSYRFLGKGLTEALIKVKRNPPPHGPFLPYCT